MDYPTIEEIAERMHALREMCGYTEEEMAVYRRGRNSNPHSVAKAASREEYQTATAVEALFGWLWLNGERERLNALFETMMEG